MYDSLVIGNTIELLNGGVASTNPLCPGAMFRLQPGADPGAPQPTTDFVASLLLDGERPFGRRASNRTVKLPIWITAPNRQILAAARELLQQVIDEDYFTITWTRDPYNGNPGNAPLPLLLDCFRAQPTVPVFNTLFEKEICGTQISVTIPALPYGRSATQEQISFSAPVQVGPPVAPPPTPIVLDNYQTIASTLCSQSTQCVIGPYTCCWDPDAFGDPGGQETPLNYSTTFAAAQNLTGMTGLEFWLGLGSRYYANLDYPGKTAGVSVFLTLTDTSGNTLSFSRVNLTLPVAQQAQAPVFTKITMHMPRNSSTFNYASVAGYTLQITNRCDRIPRFAWVTAYLDTLTALPGSQVSNPVTRGAIYTLSGLAGTARAPASLSFQQAPTAGTPTTITTAGSGFYTVPANTVWLKVECWGGGGAGANLTAAGVGAGGGGAEYAAEAIFPATAGQSIPYTVGAGDTSGAAFGHGLASVFGPGPTSTLQVAANGGASAVTNSDVTSAGGSGSTNSTHYSGGAGRANPVGTFGGGGGSSAGPTSAGNTPIGSGSVLYTTPGSYSGSGSGWLCPAGVYQVLVECWGGGGGGGSGGQYGANGAGGGGGEYRNAYVSVTPGTYYPLVVGAGGTGGSDYGNGGTGGLSSFVGDGGQEVVAYPGFGGAGNSWSSGGGGWGGGDTGNPDGYGIGTFGRSGGYGGGAYPYTGGGGSSGSPSGYGNSGWSSGGACAPTGGGSGGNGSGNQNGNGVNGSAPGGGGGGSHEYYYNGGNGAAGQVRITYPATTGAPTDAGGIAVSGGGAGGTGGTTATPLAGQAGSAPGGGGGGAQSTGSAEAGGAGAAGQIRITPYEPAAFKTLIVHRPPLGTLKTFQPLVSVGGGGDAPDGTHQYTMPQLLTGVNADFGGTYSVYLIASSWNGSGSRTVYVTVTQYEYAGGPGYSLSTLPVTFTPSQVTNGILVAGVLTLPVKAVAPDNLGGYYTVSVTDTNTSDRFYDCLFLDTMGQLVVINKASSGYVTYYIDAPDPNVSLGRIMGSQLGRPDAISVMDSCPAISGGPLYIEPADGDNMLFVYCADASAPNTSLTYSPCYYFDRTQ